MKRQITLVLFLLSIGLRAQNLLPLNPTFSMLSVNSSFAGISEGTRVQGSYSNYWSQSMKMKRTGIAGVVVDYYHKPSASGLAIATNYADIFGGLKIDKQFSFSYSKHLFAKRKFRFIPSLRYSYTNSQVRYSWLGESAIASRNYHVLAAGFLFTYKHFYLGYTTNELFNSSGKYSDPFSSLIRNNVWNMSYNWIYNKHLLLNFAMYYSNSSSSGNFQLSFHAAIDKHIILGGGVQINDASFLAAGYKAERISVMLMGTLPYNDYNGFFYNWWQLKVNARIKNKKLVDSKMVNFETW